MQGAGHDSAAHPVTNSPPPGGLSVGWRPRQEQMREAMNKWEIWLQNALA